jgi:hypothetical protein
MANGELSLIATAEATSGDVSSICGSITVIASRRSGFIYCVNGRSFGSPCLGSLSIGVGHSMSLSCVASASCSASCTFFLVFAIWIRPAFDGFSAILVDCRYGKKEGITWYCCTLTRIRSLSRRKENSVSSRERTQSGPYRFLSRL